jgi:predicted hotdog family 3-hydroxylacyl-ACP dehydratase
MAVHGALTGGASAGGAPEAGFLAGLRNVRMHVLRLDDIESDLICEAGLLAGDRGSALYEFAVASEGLALLSGRATVVFDADNRLQQP